MAQALAAGDPTDYTKPRKDASRKDLHVGVDAARDWAEQIRSWDCAVEHSTKEARIWTDRDTVIDCGHLPPTEPLENRPDYHRSIPLVVSESVRETLKLTKKELPPTISPKDVMEMIVKGKEGPPILAGCAFGNVQYWEDLCGKDSVFGRWARHGVDYRVVDRGPQLPHLHPTPEARSEVQEMTQRDVLELESMGVLYEVEYPSPPTAVPATHCGVRVHEQWSRGFSIPKPGRARTDTRFIHDLKTSEANLSTTCNKHRQDGPTEMRASSTPTTYAGQLDLFKCFYQFKVAEQLHPQLGLVYTHRDKGKQPKQRYMRSGVLSMGMKPAPEKCTMSLRGPCQALAKAHIRIPIKVDDAQPLGEGWSNTLTNIWLAAKVMTKCKIKICPKKSDPIPTQQFVWHGKRWCLQCGIQYVPASKLPNIKSRFKELLETLEYVQWTVNPLKFKNAPKRC